MITMGFLDSILGESKKPEGAKGEGKPPFNISVTFAPIRLTAMKNDSIQMLVRVVNTSGEEQLVSVDALVARNALMGFDTTCITKHTEKKVGKLAANATSEVAIPIYSTNQTKAGQYPFKIKVFAHYLNYEKVISQMEKKGEIRVV
jgi:hypothetical protein